MRNLRYISIFLLFFIGLNALAGGYLLMQDPSGGLLHMSIEQMEPAVFDDFLIPGIILFLLNGVMSVVTAVFVLLRWKGFAGLVIVQGIILSVWMVVQLFFSEKVFPIQFLVLAIGLGILVCGMRMRQLLIHMHHSSEKP